MTAGPLPLVDICPFGVILRRPFMTACNVLQCTVYYVVVVVIAVVVVIVIVIVVVIFCGCGFVWLFV